MSCNVVSGEHAQEVMLRIQNSIEQEHTGAPFLHCLCPQGHTFHLIVVDRIAVHGA